MQQLVLCFIGDVYHAGLIPEWYEEDEEIEVCTTGVSFPAQFVKSQGYGRCIVKFPGFYSPTNDDTIQNVEGQDENAVNPYNYGNRVVVGAPIGTSRRLLHLEIDTKYLAKVKKSKGKQPVLKVDRIVDVSIDESWYKAVIKSQPSAHTLSVYAYNLRMEHNVPRSKLRLHQPLKERMKEEWNLEG